MGNEEDKSIIQSLFEQSQADKIRERRDDEIAHRTLMIANIARIDSNIDKIFIANEKNTSTLSDLKTQVSVINVKIACAIAAVEGLMFLLKTFVK